MESAKHSKYYHLSAQESAKKYLCKVNIINYILITIYVALTIETVFDLELLSSLQFMFILAVAVLFGRIKSRDYFYRLQLILWEDCDPVKYLEVINIFDAKCTKESKKSVLAREKARAYCELGDDESMYESLCSVTMNPNDTTLLNLWGNFYLQVNDYEEFKYCRQRLNEMRKYCKPNSKKERKLEMISLIWDVAISIKNGKDEIVRKQLMELSKNSKYLSEKVHFEFGLAKLDLKIGKKMNAVEHLIFVRDYASTMCIQQQAAQLLESIVPPQFDSVESNIPNSI